jgi:hypothetical protein
MLPGGYHWNETAEQQIEVSSENPEIIAVSDPSNVNGFCFYIPLQVMGAGRTMLNIQLVGYYCDKGAACCFQPAKFVLPLRIEESAPLEEITAVYQLLP